MPAKVRGRTWRGERRNSRGADTPYTRRLVRRCPPHRGLAIPLKYDDVIVPGEDSRLVGRKPATQAGLPGDVAKAAVGAIIERVGYHRHAAGALCVAGYADFVAPKRMVARRTSKLRAAVTTAAGAHATQRMRRWRRRYLRYIVA